MRLRFSIRGVMALVLIVAVGIAALRSATGWAASLGFTMTLLGLSLAIPFAANRRGPGRAFWSAFVAFGFGYLLLAFGPWCETSIRPRLLTTKMLDALYPFVTPEADRSVGIWDATTEKRILSFSPDGHILMPARSDPAARLWGPF